MIFKKNSNYIKMHLKTSLKNVYNFIQKIFIFEIIYKKLLKYQKNN